MDKYKSRQKISILLVIVIFCVYLTVPAAAAESSEMVTLTVSDRANGGGITLGNILYADGEITVTGSYENGYNENIAYLVYSKEDASEIYSINEVRSKLDGSFSFSFTLADTAYSKPLVLELKATSSEEKARAEFVLDNALAVIDNALAQTKELLAACEQKGIETAYERVKYTTAKKFRDMLSVYMDNGETEAYEYNLAESVKLCQEACAALESYLDGTTEPFAAVRATADTPTVKEGKFYSDVTVNGVPSGKQPVYYLGYGHWGTTDMEDYQDLGVNTIQYELGPSSVLKKAAPVKDWSLDTYSSNNSKPVKYTALYSSENGGAVRIDSNGSGQVHLSQKFNVVPNTKYTFKVDFKCESASSIWIRANGVETKTLWIYDSRNDSEIANWKTRSAEVTTGPNQYEMTFTIGSHDNAKNLMFDNASVVRTTGNNNPNLLKNADFSEQCTDKFAINTERIQTMKSVFERAEQCGVNIIFLTAMHYFPAFLYDDDPTIANGKTSLTVGEEFPSFMPFNPTHPAVKEALDTFLDAIIPEIKDYKSLHSICISNEPAFYANNAPTYYLPKYREALKEKYGDIGMLNQAYGTAYTSFEDIDMPTSTDRNSSERKKIAYFNDYRLFNESIMTEYHKALADTIRSIDPNILLHTKGMEYMQTIGHSGNRIQAGINNEELSKFLDLNGCDAWAYYGASKDTLMGKIMWYDYLMSVKNAPVVNSEDHILQDSTTLRRREEEFSLNMADIWQGAVHGRGASALWLWDTSDRTKNGTNYYNANLTRRADYVAAIGKATLDLNRLAGELASIQDKQARVGILYSDSSMAQNPYSLQASYIAYQQVMFNGEKVFFVNETTPESLNENKAMELLIVPCCNYIKSATLEQIKQFLDGGGKVLFLNAGNKGYFDENGNAHNQTLLNSVINRSDSASFSSGSDMYVYDTSNAVSNKLNSELSKFSHAVEVSTSNKNTEWLGAEYEGSYVINICNYGDSSTSIALQAEDTYDVNSAVDLISGKKLGNSFTLAPNEFALVQVEGNNKLQFYALNSGEDRREAAMPSASPMLSKAVYDAAQAGEQYLHIVGIYENGVLCQSFVNTAVADENGLINSELNFQVDENVDLKRCGVKAFLFRQKDISPYMSGKKIGYGV